MMNVVLWKYVGKLLCAACLVVFQSGCAGRPDLRASWSQHVNVDFEKADKEQVDQTENVDRPEVLTSTLARQDGETDDDWRKRLQKAREKRRAELDQRLASALSDKPDHLKMVKSPDPLRLRIGNMDDRRVAIRKVSLVTPKKTGGRLWWSNWEIEDEDNLRGQASSSPRILKSGGWTTYVIRDDVLERPEDGQSGCTIPVEVHITVSFMKNSEPDEPVTPSRKPHVYRIENLPRSLSNAIDSCGEKTKQEASLDADSP
jgi:hypothetical protein